MDTLGPAILSFIERLSSLWRLKCTSVIEEGPQSVSFIERFFSIVSLIQSVLCMLVCYCVIYVGVAVSVAQGLINRLEREGYVRVPMKNKRSVLTLSPPRVSSHKLSKKRCTV